MTKQSEAAAEPLPDDFFEESGFRLPLPSRDEMDEAGKRAYDAIIAQQHSRARGAAGPGAGLRGPAGIQLYSPVLRELRGAVNMYLRFEAGLDGRIRELAILVAAREMNSHFEWAAHEQAARNEGLGEQAIDIVRRNLDVSEELPPDEQVTIILGRETIRGSSVSATTFERALECFGAKGLVDIVSLIGEYVAVAMLLKVFNMQLKGGDISSLDT